MYWADEIAKKIIDSGNYKPYWVDDMKTPSGRVHVGSLRGVIVHDLVYKALKNQGVPATFTYVFEDQDPMDDVPSYLKFEEWKKYLGMPLFSIPSPDHQAKNYAMYFAHEFESVFNSIDCHPKILRTGDLYKSGAMNEGIRVCLDKAAIIKSIFEETYHKTLPEKWFPFQVCCPQCGKQSTTVVNDWDGERVTFTCKVDAVKWTAGCGFTGKISPFSTQERYAGKLPWKVEWPVKWMVIGVTVEGAGKDHMSAGGSHDVAKLICEKVLESTVPYPVPYEFFLVGGKKMSSSKGRGSSAKEIAEILPSYLLRFLMTRTRIEQAIDFDPVGTLAIPDLFDEYDRCWHAYNDGGDEDLARIFELSQTHKIPKKQPRMLIPRFRDIVNYIQQPTIDLHKKYQELIGDAAQTEQEKELLNEREKYARIWIANYAPDTFRLQMKKELPETANFLSSAQKKYLHAVADLMQNDLPAEKLQIELYELAKKLDIVVPEAFAAIYESFIGKKHGPKAAWFLLQYPKDQVIKRLREASTTENSLHVKSQYSSFQKPDYFVIDPEIKKKYPSMSVGIALIKNVSITNTDIALEKEKKALLETLAGITNEELGSLPEILSYRKLYREMGIDWHSRRPSPEALLRRVALGKSLYTVNTCVDAYNLVVMKHRVSVGAFDVNHLRFPTTLRFAGEGDEILLLGDSEPTHFTAKEIAYYDKKGGYNIDFNYRDAKRTMVTEITKDLWINVDGVFDITPQQVERSLNETIAIIKKYCGGTVDFSGVVVP